MKLGLHIGSGKQFMENTADCAWINFDADPVYGVDMTPVCLLDTYFGGVVDHIIANDVLEHVPSSTTSAGWHRALKAWVRCLRPGGTIRVQVPDPEAIFARYLAGEIDEALMNRVIYGDNTGPYNRHYQMFTLKRLQKEMEDLGIKIDEAYNLHICAIVIGRRPL